MGNAAGKKETFELNEPDASKVLLVGDFTDWNENPISLKRQKDGVWKASVVLHPGRHEYRYLVDGQWRDDNSCGFRRPNGFGSENCVREVAP